jgi:HEPN domain-containing protein
MKKITREWVNKAEGDFLTAERELRAKPPNYDASAFHAQQCAEKYLKARLVEASIAFPKTHDLGILLNLLLPFEPSWSHVRPKLDVLTSLGIEVRYPGISADAEDAQEGLEAAKTVARSLGQV